MKILIFVILTGLTAFGLGTDPDPAVVSYRCLLELLESNSSLDVFSHRESGRIPFPLVVGAEKTLAARRLNPVTLPLIFEETPNGNYIADAIAYMTVDGVRPLFWKAQASSTHGQVIEGHVFPLHIERGELVWGFRLIAKKSGGGKLKVTEIEIQSELVSPNQEPTSYYVLQAGGTFLNLVHESIDPELQDNPLVRFPGGTKIDPQNVVGSYSILPIVPD